MIKEKSQERGKWGLGIVSVILAMALMAAMVSRWTEQPAGPVFSTVQPQPTEETDPIDAAADALLDTLLWEGATAEEQVCAIYQWARSSLSYGGHSDRGDWRQAAYTMLTEYRGDCYGYFAVTKLLFDRLGIPNIDVRKVKNDPDDSDHFWSMVSVDGGKTWYHFDATPRVGEGDDFCLVTDEFLDAYSENNKGSHNRDKSLYPETP